MSGLRYCTHTRTGVHYACVLTLGAVRRPTRDVPLRSLRLPPPLSEAPWVLFSAKNTVTPPAAVNTHDGWTKCARLHCDHQRETKDHNNRSAGPILGLRPFSLYMAS